MRSRYHLCRGLHADVAEKHYRTCRDYVQGFHECYVADRVAVCRQSSISSVDCHRSSGSMACVSPDRAWLPHHLLHTRNTAAQWLRRRSPWKSTDVVIACASQHLLFLTRSCRKSSSLLAHVIATHRTSLASGTISMPLWVHLLHPLHPLHPLRQRSV